MKAVSKVALVLSLAAFGATSVEAVEVAGPTDEITNGVRVVNNYTSAVRVYAEDARGNLHRLGRVARGSLEEMALPEAVAGGTFRIRVLPGAPAWSPESDDYAVKTNPLNLSQGGDVTIWVEPELSASMVEMHRD